MLFNIRGLLLAVLICVLGFGALRGMDTVEKILLGVNSLKVVPDIAGLKREEKKGRPLHRVLKLKSVQGSMGGQLGEILECSYSMDTKGASLSEIETNFFKLKRCMDKPGSVVVSAEVVNEVMEDMGGSLFDKLGSFLNLGDVSFRMKVLAEVGSLLDNPYLVLSEKILMNLLSYLVSSLNEEVGQFQEWMKYDKGVRGILVKVFKRIKGMVSPVVQKEGGGGMYSGLGDLTFILEKVKKLEVELEPKGGVEVKSEEKGGSLGLFLGRLKKLSQKLEVEGSEKDVVGGLKKVRDYVYDQKEGSLNELRLVELVEVLVLFFKAKNVKVVEEAVYAVIGVLDCLDVDIRMRCLTSVLYYFGKAKGPLRGLASGTSRQYEFQQLGGLLSRYKKSFEKDSRAVVVLDEYQYAKNARYRSMGLMYLGEASYAFDQILRLLKCGKAEGFTKSLEFSMKVVIIGYKPESPFEMGRFFEKVDSEFKGKTEKLVPFVQEMGRYYAGMGEEDSILRSNVSYLMLALLGRIDEPFRSQCVLDLLKNLEPLMVGSLKNSLFLIKGLLGYLGKDLRNKYVLSYVKRAMAAKDEVSERLEKVFVVGFLLKYVEGELEKAFVMKTVKDLMLLLNVQESFDLLNVKRSMVGLISRMDGVCKRDELGFEDLVKVCIKRLKIGSHGLRGASACLIGVLFTKLEGRVSLEYARNLISELKPLLKSGLAFVRGNVAYAITEILKKSDGSFNKEEGEALMDSFLDLLKESNDIFGRNSNERAMEARAANALVEVIKMMPEGYEFSLVRKYNTLGRVVPLVRGVDVSAKASVVAVVDALRRG